jgi:hypothetical protein
MKPLNYLTKEEKFIWRSIKEDIKHCSNVEELRILEKTLDELLERGVRRKYGEEKPNQY